MEAPNWIASWIRTRILKYIALMFSFLHLKLFSSKQPNNCCLSLHQEIYWYWEVTLKKHTLVSWHISYRYRFGCQCWKVYLFVLIFGHGESKDFLCVNCRRIFLFSCYQKPKQCNADLSLCDWFLGERDDVDHGQVIFSCSLSFWAVYWLMSHNITRYP